MQMNRMGSRICYGMLRSRSIGCSWCQLENFKNSTQHWSNANWQFWARYWEKSSKFSFPFRYAVKAWKFSASIFVSKPSKTVHFFHFKCKFKFKQVAFICFAFIDIIHHLHADCYCNAYQFVNCNDG